MMFGVGRRVATADSHSLMYLLLGLRLRPQVGRMTVPNYRAEDEFSYWPPAGREAGVCPRCGVSVSVGYTGKHIDWHLEQDEKEGGND